MHLPSLLEGVAFESHWPGGFCWASCRACDSLGLFDSVFLNRFEHLEKEPTWLGFKFSVLGWRWPPWGAQPGPG